MPWRECRKMDERLRFVARLLDGEEMAAVCREFDISRTTGYKIFNRYKECGLQGLNDRSRRPNRHANRLPFQVEKLIVQLRREHPSWGAPKIREKLRRLCTGISLPAIARCTPCLIDMVWSSTTLVELATEPKEPLCRNPKRPTIFGARTTRASSCSPIGAIAIR